MHCVWFELSEHSVQTAMQTRTFKHVLSQAMQAGGASMHSNTPTLQYIHLCRGVQAEVVGTRLAEVVGTHLAGVVQTLQHSNTAWQSPS